jgi:hypothetical protein
MKRITLLIIVLLCSFFWNTHAQNVRPIDELLEVLSQNHMGKVTDVFSIEELQIIKEHFNNESIFVEYSRAIENHRLSTTQSVTTIDAADIDLGNLSAIDVLASSPYTDFEGAGVVVRGQTNQTDVYIILDGSNILVKRNPLTGVYTEIGPIKGIPNGVSITGLTQGNNDKTLKGIATNGTTGGSGLFSINVITLVANLISGNDLVLPIALTEDGNGSLVTIDIDDDNAYKINPDTGTVTLLGAIGYDANFGQGMTYFPTEGKIYNTAYNSAIADSQLYEMNPTTGSLTAVGTIQPGITQQFGWCGYYDRDLLSVSDNTIEGFTYYPNPMKDFIVLEANSKFETIEIYTLLGEKVYSEAINTRLKRLDISFLSTGNYILKVSSENQIGTYKLLKH